MQTKDIIKKVEEYVMPIIEKNSYELVETEFVKEGANYYLRLYIDKEGGFSINDCEMVSRYLEQKLEEDDFIDKAYILEVSSPGIDRVLKKDSEYIKYKGRVVDIKLYKPIDKVKEFQGELIGLIEDKIVINQDNKEISFDKKDVAICRLAVIF
ncbi:MAG: ribosome maturation factor RimP [Lachnospirales bacterium]|nr:ribosome maturation factor RimP [Clostridiales bacterium]